MGNVLTTRLGEPSSRTQAAVALRMLRNTEPNGNMQCWHMEIARGGTRASTIAIAEIAPDDKPFEAKGEDFNLVKK